MKIRLFFLSIFVLGFCANTLAQNPYIRHYTSLNGLPTNTIYQIYQDSHKFIWFTSDAGVVKFDGSNFITYRKKDGLSSNDVVRIKEDFKGRIWFFNYNGNVNYMYNNKIYNNKNAPFLDSLVGKGFIVDFLTDENKSIYFYNWQREVFVLDSNNQIKKNEILINGAIKKQIKTTFPESLKLVHLSKTSFNDYIIWTGGVFRQQMHEKRTTTIIDSSISCMAVFPAKNNSYYVKTYNDGLIKVSSNFQKEKIHFKGNPFKINTIIEDSEGYLWIAANDDGVYCLKNNEIVKHFEIKNALGLAQDHEQNIWVSTQLDGVYLINHDVLSLKHFDLSNFDNYSVNQLCDFSGNGIMCTNTKSAYLLKNNMFYTLHAPREVQPINLLFPIDDETLLLGSISHLFCIFDNLKANSGSKEVSYGSRKSYPIAVKKIIADRSGHIRAMIDQSWIFYGGQNVPKSNSEFEYIKERINNAFFNSNNELVINAKKNYIFQSKKLIPFPELSCFDGNIITEHLVLDDSTELFTIEGDSLFILKDHRFYNLSDAFDTPVDIKINKILYKDLTLYIATIRDIYICNNLLDVLLGKPVHLEPLNVSFNNINDILIYKDTLYVASDDGLTSIAKETFTKSIASPPVPYLMSITINDQIYASPFQEIKLTGSNVIKMSFGCISYSSSTVIYSYRLSGSENKWTVGSGSSINLIYQNLPRGHYVFELRVRKSNSAWSKPLQLAITIKPTLVEYPLFWLFIAVVLAGIIFLIAFRVRSQKIKKAEVDHQLIVMEQKALQSMMNPHFIFNSLGSIQNYLLKNKGSEAVIYLSQFARLIRQNLNAINAPMIALDEEIDRLRNYIDLENKRLENKFEYSIEIDELLEDDRLYIPSMIIQPVVENSIWHGLATLDETGEIKISFKSYTSKSLKVVIEDNGIGLKKSSEYSAKSSQHQHLGMQIIQKRLHLLSKKYQIELGINYSEKSPGQSCPGAMAEIILPFVLSTDDF